MLDFLNDLLFFGGGKSEETKELTQQEETQEEESLAEQLEQNGRTESNLAAALHGTSRYRGKHRRSTGCKPRTQKSHYYKQNMDRVMLEMNAIVSDFYTDDHEVVEAYGNAGMTKSKRNPHKERMDPVVRKQVTNSLTAFEALLKARSIDEDEDDCWTECTVETGALESGAVNNALTGSGDDDCWTEYTVEASAAAPVLA